jgi:hypothetical protein
MATRTATSMRLLEKVEHDWTDRRAAEAGSLGEAEL